jgi:hypothetical protein
MDDVGNHGCIDHEWVSGLMIYTSMITSWMIYLCMHPLAVGTYYLPRGLRMYEGFLAMCFTPGGYWGKGAEGKYPM